MSATNRPAQAADAASSLPLADSELEQLLAPLSAARRVALAVSGGADSLALLDSVDRWRKAPGRPAVIVLTVDHRLQTGSSEIAAKVAVVSAARGLPCRVLIREGPVPSSGIEAAARAARYRLLLSACVEEGVSHLAVAHHRDDVAETFLMRLQRGAGVFGVAAMRATIELDDVTISRPFLTVSKTRLAATAAAAGMLPTDDPMNRDPRFARTGFRRLLGEDYVASRTAAALSFRFAQLADVMDAHVTAFLADSVIADRWGIAWLDRAPFGELPESMRQRVVVRLLQAVGGDDYPPRSHALCALVLAMGRAGRGRFKRTLSDVVVERRGSRFALYREVGRKAPAAVPVGPGETVIFDRRFAVTVSALAPAPLTLVGLPAGDQARIAAPARDLALPPGAVGALPALVHSGKTVAIPGFCEGPARFRPLLPARLSRPPLFPAVMDHSPLANAAKGAAILS